PLGRLGAVPLPPGDAGPPSGAIAPRRGGGVAHAGAGATGDRPPKAQAGAISGEEDWGSDS
ncbi:MAG TPA: hypothetical protein V6D02_04420, partial [Candidatus Obscuribacterales bacterium]